MSDRLGAEEQTSLLRLARASLRQQLLHDGSLDRERARSQPTEAMREPRGAFVSLKQPGKSEREALRGCIGCMTSREPLFEKVIELACQAAFEDPRFAPLGADELSGLRIEISALTPMRRVAGPEAIVIGRHGVQLAKGTARAVFLPQVAGEQGWTLETLLQQLARKAGLPADGWRGARFSVFEAQVFGEAGPGGGEKSDVPHSGRR